MFFSFWVEARQPTIKLVSNAGTTQSNAYHFISQQNITKRMCVIKYVTLSVSGRATQIKSQLYGCCVNEFYFIVVLLQLTYCNDINISEALLYLFIFMRHLRFLRSVFVVRFFFLVGFSENIYEPLAWRRIAEMRHSIDAFIATLFFANQFNLFFFGPNQTMLTIVMMRLLMVITVPFIHRIIWIV